MNLVKDITSSFNTSLVYGLQGDAVKVISRFGDVLIVENDKGRFPVVQENLTTETVKKKIEIIEPIEIKKVAVATAKKKHQLQTQLF